jgi:hypothetical protein
MNVLFTLMIILSLTIPVVCLMIDIVARVIDYKEHKKKNFHSSMVAQYGEFNHFNRDHLYWLCRTPKLKHMLTNGHEIDWSKFKFSHKK